MSGKYRLDAVCFDAAGTLFRLRGSVGEIYGNWAQRFGFQGGKEQQVQKKLETAFLRALKNHPAMNFPGAMPDLVKELERQWWRSLVRKTFAQVGYFTRLDDFFEVVYEFFSTADAWQLEPGAIEVLGQLQQTDKKLAIISNFDSRLGILLEDLGIRSYFHQVIVSSLAPAAKPNPLIFHYALKKLGCEAEHAIHIGDNEEEDFKAAQAAKLSAILYDPGCCKTGLIGDRIGSLLELTSILS